MPMRSYRRFSTLHQLAISVCTFAAVALLVDSGGLSRWAERLDLGPERTLALPVTNGLHHAFSWIGLEHLRHAELITLARIRWSDDPAALAEVHKLNPPAQPNSVTMVTIKNAITPATTPIVPPTPEPTSRPTRPMIGDPPLFTKLPPLPPVDANKTRTIALAGDSMMAVGLSSNLLREAPQYKDLALLKAFKSGTGLARPEVFDWQVEYPAMLKNAHPDIVLVAIGANDGQGFEQDGIVYPFGSDGWKTIYEARVQAYLDLLESSGSTVVWLGLPPMKSDTYDAHVALINRIDYAIVKASPHAIWISTAGLVGDADGHFQDFGQVDGQTVRLRQGDGIHLSDDGGGLLASHLLPWLAAQAPPPPSPPASPPSPKP
jgi:lysophospholipase L1-like esterase